MPSETVQWMDAIRRTVDEILANVNSQGQVSLGAAKTIADKHGAELHNALAELAQRCNVDYQRGIIRCRTR